jgi:DNA-directed RNA polymerase I and III subunit RPAC1
VQNLKVKIQRLSKHSVDFDIVGVDASIANAFRRIMIAEVSFVLSTSMAVEDTNTSLFSPML